MIKRILCAAMLTATVFAEQSDYAHATASETNVFLGQVFNLDILVKTGEKPSAPDFQFPELNATPTVEGQPTSEENTWLYRYAVRPKKEGELTIPALRFGSVYTKPINIRAKKPEPSDRMKLTQTVSTNSVYVGEPLVLKTQWDSTYQFGAIKAVDFHFPILNDKRFQLLDIHNPDKENQANTTGLPVHGTRILASRHSYTKDEVQHQTLEFSKILIPKKSGKIVVAPATLLCAAEQEKAVNNKTRRSAFQYPSYFDNTFFDQNVTGDSWSRIFTESAPLEVDVKPLPKEGRPDLFNGMVGAYEIDVTAEPVDVRVGEPITLTIRITAEKHMENIFFEPLRYQPNLVNRFEIPSDRSLPAREGNSKVYTQTIRPLSTDTTEIPPLQLAYFNPDAHAYAVAESDPIPLIVNPAEHIGVFGGGAQFQNRLRAVEEGIRHNYENPDMLVSRRLPLFGWAHPLAVLFILVFPPFIATGISLASLFGEKKHHIHRTAKAARAFKVFRRNVAHIKRLNMKSEIYSELDEVLRAYLGDRLHLIPGALAYRDAETRLLENGAAQTDIDQLNVLFTVCESYRFTHGYDEKADPKIIVHDAVKTVRALERSLK